jgi:hypothetical protein
MLDEIPAAVVISLAIPARAWTSVLIAESVVNPAVVGPKIKEVPLLS